MKTGQEFWAMDDEYVSRLYKFVELDINDKTMRKYIKLLDKSTDKIINVNFNWFKDHVITICE